MSEATSGGFPRRDEQRRIVVLRDLLAVTLAGVVAGAVALVALDLIFSLIGLGDFGEVNGWLAVVLPIMQLVEEFRAWKGTRWRIGVALLAAGLAVVAGLLVSGLAGGLPALFGGAIGAAAATAVYATLWFSGIRLAAGDQEGAAR